MSSGYCPKWKRILIKALPFLICVCPEGNWHWIWNKYCFCVDYNEYPIFHREKKIWREIARRRIDSTGFNRNYRVRKLKEGNTSIYQ